MKFSNLPGIRFARNNLQREQKKPIPRINRQATAAFINTQELLNKLAETKPLRKYMPIAGGVLAALLPELLALKGVDVKGAFGTSSEIGPSAVIGFATAEKTKPVTRIVRRYLPENTEPGWLVKADKTARTILGIVVGSLASTASHVADTPVISTLTNLTDDFALAAISVLRPLGNLKKRVVPVRTPQASEAPKSKK